jgi:Tfp pilus assembly protein PilF
VNHLGAGRIAYAIREFQAAEKLNPKDPWTQHGLAEAFRRRGMYAEAEQHLKNAIRLEPGFQAARLNLSALYIQMERYPEAIAQAQMLMADPTFPAPWQALSNIGFAQMRLGQRQEARASLAHALEFEPDFWRASLNLGILEAEEGNDEQAIALFQRVLASKPGGSAAAEANYRIAEIHSSRGRRAQAVAHLTAAVGSKPSGEWGKRSEEALKLLQ